MEREERREIEKGIREALKGKPIEALDLIALSGDPKIGPVAVEMWKKQHRHARCPKCGAVVTRPQDA